MSRAWLKAKRASYFKDARRLAAMGDETIGDLTGKQWAIVYKAVADELGKCADEPTAGDCDHGANYLDQAADVWHCFTCPAQWPRVNDPNGEGLVS